MTCIFCSFEEGESNTGAPSAKLALRTVIVLFLCTEHIQKPVKSTKTKEIKQNTTGEHMYEMYTKEGAQEMRSAGVQVYLSQSSLSFSMLLNSSVTPSSVSSSY